MSVKTLPEIALVLRAFRSGRDRIEGYRPLVVAVTRELAAGVPLPEKRVAELSDLLGVPEVSVVSLSTRRRIGCRSKGGRFTRGAPGTPCSWFLSSVSRPPSFPPLRPQENRWPSPSTRAASATRSRPPLSCRSSSLVPMPHPSPPPRCKGRSVISSTSSGHGLRPKPGCPRNEILPSSRSKRASGSASSCTATSLRRAGAEASVRRFSSRSESSTAESSITVRPAAPSWFQAHGLTHALRPRPRSSGRGRGSRPGT